MTGTPTASATARGQREVVAVLGAVAVHGEQDLPRPALDALARPRHRVAPRRRAPAGDVTSQPSSRPPGLASIASTTHWAPNTSAISPSSSGRATAAELTETLSAPASSTACASADRAHAAADRERHEHLVGGATRQLDDRVALARAWP